MYISIKPLLLSLIFSTSIYAGDYHKTHPEAWKATSLNSAAIALYGKKKFSSIKQTLNMELITPKALVEDPQQIPIRIRSSIPAKSVAIFVDKQDNALVAVFHRDNFEEIDLSLNIRMESKGTLFVVIESLTGVLYYKRAFIDVLCLPCMAKGN
jgi:predicted secreted protein